MAVAPRGSVMNNQQPRYFRVTFTRVDAYKGKFRDVSRKIKESVTSKATRSSRYKLNYDFSIRIAISKPTGGTN